MDGVKLFILLYLVYIVNAQYRRTPPRHLPERSEPYSDVIETKTHPSQAKSPRTRSSGPELKINPVTINKRQIVQPAATYRPNRTLFRLNRVTPSRKAHWYFKPRIGRSEKYARTFDKEQDSKIKLIKKETDSTEIEDISQIDPENTEHDSTLQPKPKLIKTDSQSDPDQSKSESNKSEPESIELEDNINDQEPSELKVESESKVNAESDSKSIPKPENEVKLEPKLPEKPKGPEKIPYSPILRPRSLFPKLVSGLRATEFECGKNNAFYAIVDSCDTFVECEKSVPNVRVCPDGLLFNRKAKWPSFPCSYPSEVECGNNTHIDTSITTPPGECPRKFGSFASSNNDCEKYIVCEDGRATLMNCPMGLGFNSKLGACDWPANIPDCNPIVFKDFVCPVPPKNDKSDKVYNYRYKNSCKLYITCFRGESRLLRCDSGLSFDDISSRCISSAAVTKCKTVSEIVDTKLLISKG